MSTKYCPKCGKKHEYSLTAPLKCEKCGVVFASAFASVAATVKTQGEAFKGLSVATTTRKGPVRADEEEIDEEYFDKNEAAYLRDQLIANLNSSPITVECKSDSVKFEEVYFDSLKNSQSK